MLRNISLFLLSCLLLFLSGCAFVEAWFDNGEREWTIMVWMDGDNNLESNAIEDFEEMEFGYSAALDKDSLLEQKLSIVVQLDRIPGYSSFKDNSGVDWTDTRRYLIKADPNPQTTTFTSTLLQNLGEVNMGDAVNLKDFIVYCKANFPAKNYALILWNHGSGARGQSDIVSPTKKIAIDETDNWDVLYTGELTDVLTDAEDVQLLGFDACYMGMAEVAYEYRPAENKFGAEIMVASPAEEQGDGWEYHKIINRLASYWGNKDYQGDTCYDIAKVTPAILGEIIVKEYHDAFDEDRDGETLTAIDLSKISGVKTSLDTLASELKNYQVETEAIRGSGSTTYSLRYFNASIATNWRETPNFDLYDFAERINNGAAFPDSVKTKAQQVMTAIDDALITSYGGRYYPSYSYNGTTFLDGRHGLAFFLPDGDNDYDSQWWYTNEDTNAWTPDSFYGKIDFCDSDTDGVVETWRELLEYWYDAGPGDTTMTPGTY